MACAGPTSTATDGLCVDAVFSVLPSTTYTADTNDNVRLGPGVHTFTDCDAFVPKTPGAP